MNNRWYSENSTFIIGVDRDKNEGFVRHKPSDIKLYFSPDTLGDLLTVVAYMAAAMEELDDNK